MKLPSLFLATLLLLSSSKIAFTQEQPICADIDCNYKLRTVGPKHTSDYAIYLGKLKQIVTHERSDTALTMHPLHTLFVHREQ